MQTQTVCLNISYSHNWTDPNPIAYAPLLKNSVLLTACLLDGEAIINTERTTTVQNFY